jgi:hypothetical protein
MSSELHRFGFYGDGDEDRWKAAVENLLRALITNPHLRIGDQNSQIEFPSQAAPSSPKENAAGSAPSAFFRVFVDEDKRKLQGGQVSGGTGNIAVPDIDLATVGSEPADGTLRWLRITFNGSATDGWLNAGGNVTAVTPQSGTSLPANTLPTAASPSGKHYHLLLGSWSGDVFLPSQPGNIAVGFCSDYTISRG